MDFKNGTIIVAIATLVIAALMLSTGRDKTDIEENVEHETNEEMTEELVTSGSETAQTESENNNNEAEILSLSAENAVQINAPDGPFDKYSGSGQITETKQSSGEDTSKSNQPIWLDQGLGDFKSIDKGPVVFNIMPSSPDDLQGENPKQVVTSKSDRFVSFGIPADYNYQRMPMYNGGYYIAPMPSYLMPSMLPKSLEIDDQ